MTEKWLIAPGEERVIDIESVTRLKVGLVGGQVDIIAHDEPGIRIEVHGVTTKDLRIESHDGEVEIDHPQLGWDNFLEVFRNFGSGGPAGRGERRGPALDRPQPRCRQCRRPGLRHPQRRPPQHRVRRHHRRHPDRRPHRQLRLRRRAGARTDGLDQREQRLGRRGGTGAIRKATVDIVSGAHPGGCGRRREHHQRQLGLRRHHGAPRRVARRELRHALAERSPPDRRRGAQLLRSEQLHRLHRRTRRDASSTCARTRSPAASPCSAARPHPSPNDAEWECDEPAVFSHGDLRLYLLSLLAEAPQHGYGIIQALTDRTGGTYTPVPARSIRGSRSSRRRAWSPRPSTDARRSTRSPTPDAPNSPRVKAISPASRPGSPIRCG